MPQGKDKDDQTVAIQAVQAQLSRLLTETAVPGFYGRVSIDVFIENGRLMRCNPLRNQTVKLNH